MFLSDNIVEVLENVVCKTPEDETYLLLFLYEICIDEIKETVPRVKGEYCKTTLKYKIIQLNNILNLAKKLTGTELYEKDAFKNHIYRGGKTPCLQCPKEPSL